MSTFTNESVNSATLTNTAINSATYTNQAIGSASITATAGQAMGLLLALTYSGGQILSTYLPTITHETIN